jgi:polysaccharide biosynthesis/export protein
MPGATMKYKTSITSYLLLTAILTVGYPAAGQSPSNSSGDPAFQERYPRYRLRPGDVMELSFPFTPEFNQTVTIQPDGYINVPRAGDMRVEGKTTAELVQAMKVAYRGILNDPEINVKLTEFEKPYFVVSGEVGHPGKYDLRGDTTVSQAVAIAGGFSGKAKTSEIVLFRRVSDQWAETRKIDLKRMLNNKELDEDLHLRPGDMVLVPQSTMSKLARFIPIPSLGMYLNPLTK